MAQSIKASSDAVRGVRLAQDRSRETLRRILDAAVEVFVENGYMGTTASKIISQAGIGHGTFWLYFHNKDDLLQYMVRDMIGELEVLEWYRQDDLESLPVRSLPEVENIIRGVMEIFSRYSAIHPLIITASLESEEFRKALDDLNQPFVDILGSKLQEHLEKGLCADLNPEVTARIIVAMLEFTNVQWLNESLPAEKDDLIHGLSVIIHRTLNHAG